MYRNLEILFKFWLNSGYRKSQKALDQHLKNFNRILAIYIYSHSTPAPKKRLPRTLEFCRKSADNSRDIRAVAVTHRTSQQNRQLVLRSFRLCFSARIPSANYNSEVAGSRILAGKLSQNKQAVTRPEVQRSFRQLRIVEFCQNSVNFIT